MGFLVPLSFSYGTVVGRPAAVYHHDTATGSDSLFEVVRIPNQLLGFGVSEFLFCFLAMLTRSDKTDWIARQSCV